MKNVTWKYALIGQNDRGIKVTKVKTAATVFLDVNNITKRHTFVGIKNVTWIKVTKAKQKTHFAWYEECHKNKSHRSKDKSDDFLEYEKYYRNKNQQSNNKRHA